MILSNALLRLRTGVPGLRAFSQNALAGVNVRSTAAGGSGTRMPISFRSNALGVTPSRPSGATSRPLFAFRWHSSLMQNLGSGVGDTKAAPTSPLLRFQAPGLNVHASWQHSDSKKPGLPSFQIASFSTDDESARRRAERRRARLRGGRPTMTKEREREQVTGEPVSYESHEPSSRRQIDAMSEGQGAYLRRVWGLAGANVGVASIGCIGGMALGISPLISFGGALVSILGLSFGAPKGSNPALRAGLLASSALFIGASCGPLVGMSLAMDPLLLPMALGASGGIFAGATAFSLFAPEGRMLSLGGPLFGGLMVLVGAGLIGMFYPHPVLHSISLYGGLALFSVYVAYDTQMILDDYKNGETDAVQHSLQLFLNFVNIFKRVLFIFMNDD